MKKTLIAGLALMALVACGKKEEPSQEPAPAPQSEQMPENNMAPMEDAQPKDESSTPSPAETPQQPTEPQAGSQDGQPQGAEEPMAMPQETPDDATKE